ncbi:MAG: dockerin type I domain-containing protein, partial [Planctomycetota bacterium]|nr:dockerin type I domain-containing protein [Planctomycetota bacterium]
EIYLDGELLVAKTLSGPDQSLTGTFVPLEAREYVIEAIADVNNEVMEAIETNNSRTGTFLVYAECTGDTTGDGLVNHADLALILGTWGTSDERTDIDGDGTVNASDLSIMLSFWGRDCMIEQAHQFEVTEDSVDAPLSPATQAP